MGDAPFDLSNLNLGSLLNMAQEFQGRLKEMENAMARIEIESMVGGGMVTVKANAKGEVISIKLDPELLALNDRALIENLVTAGVNQALAEARNRREEEMRKVTGNMVLPGWFA